MCVGRLSSSASCVAALPIGANLAYATSGAAIFVLPCCLCTISPSCAMFCYMVSTLALTFAMPCTIAPLLSTAATRCYNSCKSDYMAPNCVRSPETVSPISYTTSYKLPIVYRFDSAFKSPSVTVLAMRGSTPIETSASKNSYAAIFPPKSVK